MPATIVTLLILTTGCRGNGLNGLSEHDTAPVAGGGRGGEGFGMRVA